jgi:hypothetical protein
MTIAASHPAIPSHSAYQDWEPRKENYIRCTCLVTLLVEINQGWKVLHTPRAEISGAEMPYLIYHIAKGKPSR